MFYRLLPIFLLARSSCSSIKSSSRVGSLSLKMSTLVTGRVTVNVLVPVANGSEEIETTTIANTLVRGGARVTLASVAADLTVIGSRGIKLTADKFIDQCVDDEWDLVVCPGGMPGAEHLRDSSSLRQILSRQNENGKLLGAVCAAPAVVLSTYGILTNKKATGYPAQKFINLIPNYSKDSVVVDGNVVTSQGPATSLPFALKLVEILFGEETAQRVSQEMLFK